MNLEIKHIQHYPIGGENALRFPEGHLIGFNEEEEKNFLLHIRGAKSGLKYGYYLADIKPLLRPMSDLYVERNGKIDIVELAKMSEYPYSTAKWEIEKNKCMAETDTFFYEFWIEDYIPFITEYSKNIFGEVLGEDTVQAFSPIMFFEYLFANHYDVFGLIDQGLAIDINTIKE